MPRTTNIDPYFSRDQMRGRVAQGAAASGQVIVTDGVTEVDAIQITVAGGTVTEIADGVAQINLGGGSPSGLAWFNVTDYGALGDGTTDDTSSVNDAIAALNTAGRGVLYFPASDDPYRITSSLTTITVPCLILGDGWATNASGPISRIDFESTSTSLFTITANGCTVRDLAMVQTGGTATAGAAITTTGGILAEYEHILISAFWQGIDLENSLIWAMRRCYIEDSRKYGIRIRNTSTPDAGDWLILGCTFSNSVAGDAAIRCESSGGGKIIGNKVNAAAASGSNRFAYGLDIVMGSLSTSVFLIQGNSLENVTTDAIRIDKSGTGNLEHIVITGNQIGLYGNNAGYAVNLSGSGLDHLIVAHNTWKTNGTARAAVSVTNSLAIRIGPNDYAGFNAEYTNSGGTVVDDTGALGAGVAITGTPSSGDVPIASSGTAAAWGPPAGGSGFATPAIVLGTAAAAGAASTVIRSDSTIVAFDTTVPVTQAYSDAAATGSAAVAARRDHRHGMPAASGGVGEILISDTPSTPLIFADLLQNEAQDDLLYADP